MLNLPPTDHLLDAPDPDALIVPQRIIADEPPPISRNGDSHADELPGNEEPDWEQSTKEKPDKLPPKPVKPPLDFRRMMKFDSNDDANCLIGRRYLCRGGSAIWVGSSGLGKSVITIQAAITFALNESLFGLECHKPLKSIIFSAEDDEGDISETVQGVLKGMGITEDDPRFQICCDNVLIFQESTLKGLNFIGHCEQMVKLHSADLVWINPLLSYYAGNPSDPEKSAEFTGALSQMQVNTGVCSMLIHHTGKPKDSETTKGWSMDDFSYIGLGSSVWTNWARAIIVLQSIKEPAGVFILRFAKRGNRAGIVNDDFEKVRELYLEHSPIGLRWVLSQFCPEPKNEASGRPSKASWSRINENWDGVGQNDSEMRQILRDFVPCSDKTARRIMSKWAGIYIIKNTKDLWVKAHE